ncbi:MAG: fibronectin type III domain-containing protein, partial [Bacteroides sp.]|nr:fibronectin type III domain-containing protein [Bacteroides sp.]
MKKQVLFRTLLSTLCASVLLLFAGGRATAEDTYTLVKDVAGLSAGDVVLIVGEGGYAMTAATNSSKRTAVAVTVSGESISNPTIAAVKGESSACAFTLERDADGKYAFHDLVNKNYLTGTTSNNSPSATTVYYFTVNIANTGIAQVIQGSNSRYLRCYNNQDFRLYTSTSNGNNVYLYKKQVPSTDPFVSTSDNEVSYKTPPSESLNKTLSFTAGNLTEDLTVSVASATEGQNAVVAVNPTTISKDQTSFNLTLTTSTLAEGTYSDIITIKSGDATMATVKVSLTVADATVYKKITTVEQLGEGGTFIFVSSFTMSGTDYRWAMLNIDNNNRYGKVDVEITDDAISLSPEATPVEVIIAKEADGKYTLKNSVTGKYFNATKGNNGSTEGTSATEFLLNVSNGNFYFTLEDATSTTGFQAYKSSTSEWFQYYRSSQKAIQLYRKDVPVPPTCGEVSDVQVNAQAAAATLTWTAPDPAPAKGYEINITDMDEVDVTETVAGTQYTCSGLAAGTEYMYTITAVCGDDLKGEAVDGTFETPAADAPSLTVTAPENNRVFTGDVTFAFTTENFTLGEDKQVKVVITETAANTARTVYSKENTFTESLPDGAYRAEFSLVSVSTDGGEPAYTPVEGVAAVTRNFSVRLPYLAFTPDTLKLSTYQGVAVSGEVTITVWARPEDELVQFTTDNEKFTIDSAPSAVNVTGDESARITVTYDGSELSSEAVITATCGSLSGRLIVKATATAVPSVDNLKGLYGKADGDTVSVKGKMVVTHKDDYNNRIWVQDIEKENGASMLLYKASDGYAGIGAGDVLENVTGKVAIYNGLYEFTPLGKLAAVEHGHDIYVDTLTADYINKNIATVQNALVCVKNVTFTAGTFSTTNATERKLTLNQGSVKLEFYTTFNNADYVGESTPVGRLYVTGILGNNKGTAQITARSKADMVEAPCLLPYGFHATPHADEAVIEWEGEADSYGFRHGTAENLEGATEQEVSAGYIALTGLTPQTQYFYQVRSRCDETSMSGWSAVQTFTTLSATAPSLGLVSPTSGQEFADSAEVSFSLRNVTLRENDTMARISFSNGDVIYTTQTTCRHALPTGDYRVMVELVKDNDTLVPRIRTNERAFRVDLPDVAAPVFMPAAGRYADSVEVALNCDTEGASIFYAKDDGDYAAYTAGSKILLRESSTLKAFACKERMDTSAVVTAAYTVAASLKIEGDLVFLEGFSKSEKASTSAISDFDKVTDMPGWSGENMYPEVSEIKGGTSSKKGKLVSPAIDLGKDGGKYYVAFMARAYNNKNDGTSIQLTAGEETVQVEGLDKESMTEYVYMFNNGTATTRLTFEAINAGSNRFYLDSIRVYQVLPAEPMIIAPATLSMTTVQGTPVSQTVTVKGKLLDEDVAVTCPEGNFTVSPATLAKA